MYRVWEVFNDGHEIPVFDSDERIDCEVFVHNYRSEAMKYKKADLIIEEEELYFVATKSGDLIEIVHSYDEGLDVIRSYEEEDKAEGNFSPDFYEIEDEEHYRLTKVDGKVMRVIDAV